MRAGWVASRESWASLLWCDLRLSWPLTAVVSPALVFRRNQRLQAERGLARVRAFFSAPVVVFHMNILSYFAFLCLFAYVLMVDFQPQPSGCEYLIYVWLFSLVCEELRQVGQPAPTPPADPPTPRSTLGSVTFSWSSWPHAVHSEPHVGAESWARSLGKCGLWSASRSCPCSSSTRPPQGIGFCLKLSYHPKGDITQWCPGLCESLAPL